jgi:hypothetical protein
LATWPGNHSHAKNDPLAQLMQMGARKFPFCLDSNCAEGTAGMRNARVTQKNGAENTVEMLRRFDVERAGKSKRVTFTGIRRVTILVPS